MAITKKNFQNSISTKKIDVKVNLSTELEGLTVAQKKDLKQIVGDTIVDEVRESSRKKTSSVTGRAFPKLSKEYRAIKRSAGGVGQPNLRLTGNMLDSLGSNTNRANGVSVTIPEHQAGKSFNHIKGDTLPKRQFLPDKGQAFKKEIMKAINQKVRDFKKTLKK